MRYAAHNIPGNLTRLRTARDMSAADLARTLDVSKVYIGKLERGDKVPNVARLIDLARVLKVSPDTLLRPPTDEKSPD